MEKSTALGTGCGVAAVLMWALLALFTTATQGIPPFQVLAVSFAIVFVFGTGLSLARGRLTAKTLRQPKRVWALGIGALFFYHFFYFLALKNAPAADASLIAYLWPLLIVVFSGFLPGERMRGFHLTGALMGFAGAGLLVTKGQGLSVDPAYALGYLSACCCALIWSGYSVVNRLFKTVPTDIVGPFCGGVAILGFISHLAFETWVQPDFIGWLALVGLGIGPVGASFFLWDYGTKHGRIQFLGALSYLAPLFSTILLVVFGQAPATLTLGLACILIVAGAVVASGKLRLRRLRAAEEA